MNLTVQTPDERLAGLVKPVLQSITQFELMADDWLVVCAGFEDRALGILQNAVLGREQFNVLVIDYSPFVSENKLVDIRRICGEAALNSVEVLYNREEPAGFGAKLLESFQSVTDASL